MGFLIYHSSYSLLSNKTGFISFAISDGFSQKNVPECLDHISMETKRSKTHDGSDSTGTAPIFNSCTKCAGNLGQYTTARSIAYLCAYVYQLPIFEPRLGHVRRLPVTFVMWCFWPDLCLHHHFHLARYGHLRYRKDDE